MSNQARVNGQVRTLTATAELDEESGGVSERLIDITINGRGVEVPEAFRQQVAEKLAKADRLTGGRYRFAVELSHERNRRQLKVCQRVEVTATGRGPLLRSEAGGENFYAALEEVIDRLERNLRRVKDRRLVHHGSRTPISVAEATAPLVPRFGDPVATAGEDAPLPETDLAGLEGFAAALAAPDGTVDRDPDGPGQIVRTKVHSAVPMTVDDALTEMELVGHDFYLFHDKTTDRPSVVYRRRAFDYGLIRLA